MSWCFKHKKGGMPMGKSLEKLAYDLITKRPFLISIERARKWAPGEVPEVSADDLLELADMARRREVLDLEVKKPIVVECLGDPRVIDTKQGGWDVLDVSLPDGSEHLLSLGHTVLKSRIAEKMPVAGKKLVIMALGKPPGKKYYNYVVLTVEEWEAAQKRKKTEKAKK